MRNQGNINGFSLILAALTLLWGAAQSTFAAPSEALDLARQLNQAFIAVSEQVSPAVVVVKVAQKPGSGTLDFEDDPTWERLPKEFRKQLRDLWEKQQQEKKQTNPHREPVLDAQGSGVIIREEGYILTNRHVVDEAEKIVVRLRDGAELEAEVKGMDAQSDLAVIKVNPGKKKLTACRLGDSDAIRVGEFAIAIGAPFELEYSVTYGHVSAKSRSNVIPFYAGGATMDQDFIQTDANINPGNSGGPLVNIEGEVIGINTLIRGLRSGIGFAIPINFAREVSDQLIHDGKYVRSWLGIKIRALKDDPQTRATLPDIEQGVIVSGILTNGPAGKSQLKPSDVITKVDGKTVGNEQELRNQVRRKKVGQLVTLDVQRNARPITVEVTTEAWPEDAMAAITRPTILPERTERVVSPTFGITVKKLTKELAQKFGIEKASPALVVTEVEEGSVAEERGIEAGNLISEVNQRSVTTVKEFEDALKKGDRKKGVLITVLSEGESRLEVLRDESK